MSTEPEPVILGDLSFEAYEVDVGVLESRDYPFTLNSIGGIKVASNTVNAKVFG